MPTFRSFAEFGAELDRMAGKLTNSEKRRITRDMAEKAQQIAERAASSDLGGDPKFSGWAPRLDTQIKAKPGGVSALIPTRSSAGPWTVAERGRNQGNASGFSGPGINRRTGITSRRRDGSVRRVRTWTGRSRWNGYTRGKNTASDAVAEMERQLPRVAEDGVVRVMRQHFDVS